MPVAASPDGRVLRGRRNREAVVDALLALIEQGVLRPTADAIAERAGLSRRSVFQHFNDIEGIFEEAGQRTWTRLEPLFEPFDVTSPTAERIDGFVERRREIFELIAPVARSSRLREPFSPQLRVNRDNLVAQLVEQCRQAFEPELAGVGGEQSLTALSAATSWDLWDHVRSDLGLDRNQALAVVRLMVQNLLPTRPMQTATLAPATTSGIH